MAKGLFIVGTDTDAGKTVVTAGLMYLLRSSGYNACYFKPALSGAIESNGSLIPGDTRFVKAVSRLDEPDENITPYIFRDPVSPHLASRRENTPIDIKFIKEKLSVLKNRYDYIVVEGSGGLAVPLVGSEYMFYDLIKELDLDCIIVARAGLGTINHTVLTAKFAQSLGISIVGIIINNYTGTAAEDDNIDMIKTILNINVVGIIPRIEEINAEKFEYGKLREVFAEKVNVGTITKLMGDF